MRERSAVPRRRSVLARVAHSAYVVALMAVMAAVDYRLHRSVVAVVVLVGGAVATIVVAPLVRRIAGRRLAATRIGQHPALRMGALALAAVAAYLVRWRGALSIGTALVVMAVPAATGVLLTMGRPLLERPLGPLARVRNRLLPRWLRQVIAVVAPLMVTFGLVHGTLGDLTGLFGGDTSGAPAVADKTLAMTLGGLLSMAIVFLVMFEPAGGRRKDPR